MAAGDISRRGEFLSKNIQTTTEVYQKYNVAAEIRFISAQTWSHFLYFALLGFVLFLIFSLEHPYSGNLSVKPAGFEKIIASAKQT